MRLAPHAGVWGDALFLLLLVMLLNTSNINIAAQDIVQGVLIVAVLALMGTHEGSGPGGAGDSPSDSAPSYAEHLPVYTAISSCRSVRVQPGCESPFVLGRPSAVRICQRGSVLPCHGGRGR